MVELNPIELTVDVAYPSKGWATSDPIVTVTHIPTGLIAKAEGRSTYAARAAALQALRLNLENNTDYFKQKELF